MATDRSYVAKNDEARARQRALVGGLSDADLAGRCPPAGRSPWHRLLRAPGRAVSQSGRLRHGNRGHQGAPAPGKCLCWLSSNASPEEQRERARGSIPAKRFGTAEEFGAACAFLCSAHAGFITGQNVLLDGGQCRGLL